MKELLSLFRTGLSTLPLCVWMIGGLPFAWENWWAAMRTPSATGLSYEQLRATLPDGPLNSLLAAARNYCVAEPALVIMSDNVAAWIQGNYLLYPRRIDVIQSVDGLTIADFTVHDGGCLLSYQPNADRLETFSQHLSEITCAGESCLYRIALAGGRD